MTAQQREQEIMGALHESRRMSSFWLDDKQGRRTAFERLEKRGLITARNIGYPCYRVVIHKRAKMEGE